MKEIFKPFWLAVQFMSRLPTPQYETVSEPEMGRAAPYFPLVGVLIGGLLWLSAQLSHLFNAEITAALVLAVWAWSTGALHLDGLADTADGWLGATGNPQRALEIMKDSRIGTGGGVALTLHLLLKWSVLIEIIAHQAWLWLFLAPILGRIASISLMPNTPYQSYQGLAQAMVKHLQPWKIYLWTFMAIVTTLWLAWPVTLILVLTWLWARWLMIRITGGMTGDTAGMMTELIELATLLGVVAYLNSTVTLIP